MLYKSYNTRNNERLTIEAQIIFNTFNVREI